MQFHIQTDKNKVLVLAEVAKIEVEDILSPEVWDDLYFRRVRFVTNYVRGGKWSIVWRIQQKELRLHQVKKLRPVKKPKGDNWLTPEVYTGDPGEDTDQESE